jgi:uncharacterized protein with FMN-binding domain
MRRAAALVLGTLAGTGLLVGAKVGNAAIGGPVADATGGTTGTGVVVTGPGPATTSGPPTPAVGPSGAAPRPPRASASTGAMGKPTKTPAPGPTSTATPTPTPTHTPTPTPSAPKDGTYKASSSEHYGTVSLTVTISGHKITDIVASYASNSPSYCTQKACPKLRSEALSAQSAKIATVGGATYTSEAYIAALSAILKSAA